MIDLSNATIGPPVKLPPGIVTGIAPPRATGKARGKAKSTGSALVKACLEYLHLRGVMAWRNNTTGVFDPARKIFRTFQGRKGVSDILGILPTVITATGGSLKAGTWEGVSFTVGRLLAVECKDGTGRLTKEQRDFLAAVNKAGGLGIVVHDLGQLMEVVK